MLEERTESAPPASLSSDGAHSEPFHFRTCPVVGVKVVVSTSAKSLMVELEKSRSP